MPLYEFRCPSCGERFESLVGAGTEGLACRRCGAPGAERVLSVPAQQTSLVRSPRANRAQGRRNAELRARAKAEFKARRRRAGESGGGGAR